MANPLSYMLGSAKSNEAYTQNLYAQLQAPAQREAVQTAMNKAVTDSAPIMVTQPTGEVVFGGYNQFGDEVWNEVYETIASPNPNAVSYENAATNAARAAYGVTINPKDLVRDAGSARFQQPGYIKNAYITPDKEGAYDLSPDFDWKGQLSAGLGAKSRPQTQSERLMQDQSFGPRAEQYGYDKALLDNLANASFGVEYANDSNREARQQYQYYPRAVGSTLSPYNPDASYNAWKSLSPLWQPASVADQIYGMNQ